MTGSATGLNIAEEVGTVD